MSRVRALPLVLALVACMLPLGAQAQQPAPPQQPAHPAALAPRQANYAWDQNLLRASFSYRDVLSDPELVHKMSSGLKMQIVMRAYVYREGEDTPVALAPRVCTVSYDPWEEVYRVHVTDPDRPQGRDQAVLLDEHAIRICAEAQNLPIVRRDLLTAGQAYFLGVVVDVNPVSAEMVEQMRRWIARPTGSTGIGPSDALFGGFVQLFVRQIATSDKTLMFRTQSIVP